MTAPCDPEAAPEPRQKKEEIVLRLGDILPRVPGHLLKPGNHDPMSQIRFSVEELADKIARGRVSVPLERLASACPEVFQLGEGFPEEHQIQLPLQKLLEQVSLSGPKTSAPNGMPAEPPAGAGAVISGAAASPAPSAEAAAAVPAEAIPDREAEVPSPHPPRIARAIATARQILGVFGRSKEPEPQEAAKEAPEAKPPSEGESFSSAGDKSVEAPAAAPGEQLPAKPAAEPVPAGFISLRVLPIFRLLPPEVLRPGPLPSEEVRITLPLSSIDSQLAGGHVEIPLDVFVQDLPEALRPALNPAPDAQVWIPLDEIFQSLPPDHLFYMPPFEPTAGPEAAGNQETEPVQTTPGDAGAEIAVSDPPPATPPAREAVPVAEPSPEPPAEPPPMAQEAAAEAAVAPPTDPPAASPRAASPPQHEPEPAPSPAAALSSDAPPAETAPASPASRAPWMRGFQVPPPVLFSSENSDAPAASPPEPAATEPAPPPAPTPEARRTVDFLAAQPGVFAAAAFVEGAVFASADFPRKPDLDALRDFMAAFVDRARESGQRLGWNRVLTIACEQFQLTAVVRDTHFIVALHHDRMLPTLTHDALIAAANDLGKPAGQNS